jgi:nitrite reductase/ring-hydroxylating ferredoxin subunit/DMSO/TMAO reductase YedYZ heme-binding membrane subunit
MSVAYQAVGWNRQKKIYDLTLAAVLLLGLAGFGASVLFFHPATTIETFLIRFTALSAFLLLHVILAVGPLARLDRRFLPLLYNRRHLGVTLFFLGAFHAVFAVVQFHALGDANPLASAFGSYAGDYVSFWGDFRRLSRFPFESLGAGALLVFFLMAATSHDFWLKNLGPSCWKLLHMSVYAAYGLVAAHVALGALQIERSLLYPVLLGSGGLLLAVLHLGAWRAERRFDLRRQAAERDGFEPVAASADLEEGRGKVVVAGGMRIALFLHQGRLFALSNACRHQGGPLGEGRVVYGCLTCPWHGYQYQVEDGCSPPPFTEIVPTYPVRLVDGTVYVKPEALPLRTKSEGIPCGPDCTAETPSAEDFYIGWQGKSPAFLADHARRAVAVLSIAVPVLMALIAWQQNPVDEGAFEYGKIRAFEGILRETPLPLLQTGEGLRVLVGAGKFGPPPVLRGHDGDRVRFEGTLIHRRNMGMVEVTRPETFRVLEDRPGPEAAAVTDLGEAVFTGELVDMKCFLGVMRPATGKAHKGCAIRCLSGGAPPGLLFRDQEGNGVVLLLAGEDGKPLAVRPEWAADAFTARGRLELHQETPILKVHGLELAEP